MARGAGDGAAVGTVTGVVRRQVALDILEPRDDAMGRAYKAVVAAICRWLLDVG